MGIHVAATRLLVACALGSFAVCGSIAVARQAHADAVGYLVNITVRPGYNFPNPDAAVAYGYGICDRIQQGKSYGPLLAGIMTDLFTTDEYQAAYLVNQAAEMLCPAAIWQLRQSAANYVGPANA
jgi:hypothetical protein